MPQSIQSEGHPRPVTAGVGELAAERGALLEAAGSGDPQAVGQLCDRHGAALISVARAILGDSARAETVVVEVVARACADSGSTAAAGGSLRRELARLTYLHAISCLDGTQAPERGSAMAKMAAMTELARRQRSAVALVQYGDHTLGDVAEVLDRPVHVVAALLCSGLKDLEAADRRAPENASGVRNRGGVATWRSRRANPGAEWL